MSVFCCLCLKRTSVIVAEVVPDTELVIDTKLPAEVPETCVPVEINAQRKRQLHLRRYLLTRFFHYQDYIRYQS